MNNSTITCPHCGSVNVASARFCSNCGSPLTVTPPQPIPSHPASPRTGRTLVIVLAAIVLIAALGLLIHSAATSTGLFTPAVTATPTATATPLPTPTPVGISPDQDLTALIAGAADGDTLTLAAGTFTLTKGLTIDKNLTLVGAGYDQTTITSALPDPDASTVFFYTGTGKLTFKSLTLSYTGSDPAALIAAKSGTLELQDCYLKGATLSSKGNQLGTIQIINDAAVLIRNCHIEGNTAAAPKDNPQKVPGGIIISNNAKATIEDSEIFASYLGIYASGSTDLTLTNTTIRSTYSGVTLLENATASIQGNTFQDNTQSSLTFFNSSKAVVTGNTVSGTADSLGIDVTGNANVALSNNKISRVLGAIVFSDSATGTADSNQITGFSNVGITVNSSASPELSQNAINSPSADNGIGITYNGNSAGSAHDNRLADLYLGISVSEQAAPLLQSNQISTCQTGMSFTDDSASAVKSNTIQADQVGIMISSPAHPSLTDNDITAYLQAIMTEPDSWLAQIISTGNTTHDGPPIVKISTFTPEP